MVCYYAHLWIPTCYYRYGSQGTCPSSLSTVNFSEELSFDLCITESCSFLCLVPFLQYAELKPVPCLSYADAVKLRESSATPILTQVTFYFVSDYS